MRRRTIGHFSRGTIIAREFIFKRKKTKNAELGQKFFATTTQLDKIVSGNLANIASIVL